MSVFRETLTHLRLLVYNIRYATGTGVGFHLPIPGAGYLRSSRRVLEQITRFIRSEQPDVVGLIEIDTGSVRTGMLNQAGYATRHHYTHQQVRQAP
jgi:endonuclease/exonuclease/phosphatase family metal-dependent hydrolase